MKRHDWKRVFVYLPPDYKEEMGDQCSVCGDLVTQNSLRNMPDLFRRKFSETCPNWIIGKEKDHD